MIRRYIDKQGHSYSEHDLRKAGARIVYWVIFPQGVECKDSTGVTYSSMMEAKTFKKAIKLYNRYHGAIIERNIESKLGRWCVKDWYAENLSYDDLWDKWIKKYEKIYL